MPNVEQSVIRPPVLAYKVLLGLHPTADLSALAIQSAPITWHAFGRSVKTLAQVPVDKMQNAESLIMHQCAFAFPGISVIRSHNVLNVNKTIPLNGRNLVLPVHVVQMQFVESKMALVPALAYQNTLEIHTRVVAQNVS